VDTITIETWKNQIKTDEKIEKLSLMVEELSKSNGSSQGKIDKNNQTTTEVIKISGKLLTPLMPTITPVLMENK
jgi:hypothetical protein